MKKGLVWLGILVIVGMLCGCDTKETYHAKEESSGDSVAKEVGDVIDYGIGVTQTRALKKAHQQVQQLNEQHNRDLEEAMQ